MLPLLCWGIERSAAQQCLAECYSCRKSPNETLGPFLLAHRILDTIGQGAPTIEQGVGISIRTRNRSCPVYNTEVSAAVAQKN